MSPEPLFDPDASRRLEAVYQTPDVVGQRHATLNMLALWPGERVLDIGCGPGLLVAEMAQAVESGGHVIGLEISSSMLVVAYNPNTYSISNGEIMVEYVIGRNGITRDDAEVWWQELQRLGEQGRYFFSLNRYLFIAVKPERL